MGIFKKITVTSLLLAQILGAGFAEKAIQNSVNTAQAASLNLTALEIDGKIQELKGKLRKQGVDAASIDSYFRDENFNLATGMFEAKRRCPGLMNYEWFRCEHDIPSKIVKAPSFFRKHNSLFEEAERKYGVNIQIGIGILALETNFSESRESEFLGRYNPFNALVTLYIFTSKKAYALNQIVELHKWVTRTGRYIFDLRSSYMGAIGIPQFLPSSLNNYYVGRDDDIAKADPFNLEDAVFSIGNYLIKNGWDPAQSYITKDSKNWRSLLRYNRWDCYVAGVLEIGDSLRFADIPEIQHPLMPAGVIDPQTLCVKPQQSLKKK